MGKILSRLCPCLGRETSINNEDVVIRTDFSQYTQTEYKEYNYDNLNHEELQTPLRYYAMRHNRGCC